MEFCSFDATYLERLAARDAGIERHFHDYFSELIHIKLRSRHYPPHAIDDIRQETFLRVFQAIRRDGIRDPQRIGAFVNSVCNFVALEYGRASARHALPDGGLADVADERADSERDLAVREDRDRVHAILADLTDKNRRLLQAVFLEERSPEEICSQFGVDSSYLRVLLFRARAEFRQALEDKSP